MITRKVLHIDRLATLVLALLLMAAGALGVWWWTGESPLSQRVATSPTQDMVAMSWWPWASGAAGVLLILLGLWWLLAHLRRRTVKQLSLEGTGSAGKFGVDGSKVAGAAADAFADTLGVRSAKGTVDRDRGQLVAHLIAVIEPEADLAEVARHADLVSAQLGEVLGRDDVRCGIELTVATRGKSLARVR